MKTCRAAKHVLHKNMDTSDIPAKSIGNGLVFAHDVCHAFTLPSSQIGPSHRNPPHIPTGQTENFFVARISRNKLIS